MKIGVFDSGTGGALIAERLKQLLPGHEWVIINDLDHVPYGEKTADQIISLTDTALQPLLPSCPIIVIACNTATAAALTTLRERYPGTKFVGVEPMIKPAALGSVAKHVTVLGTPFTLANERYVGLKSLHSSGIQVDEPDSTGWPRLIDMHRRADIDFSRVSDSVASGSDTIVLACTHYLDLIESLRARYPNVAILEPSEALARQITRLLTE